MNSAEVDVRCTCGNTLTTAGPNVRVECECGAVYALTITPVHPPPESGA